jgi:hypothetical protein
LRSVLVLGVVVVAAVGGAATAWVVHDEGPAALRSVLAVQGGTLFALAIAVWVLLQPTVSRLDELVEALRAFARGERHTRVHPADFAGLADVARAVNDVGASLCENDDPNLGPVQRKVREKAPARPPSEEPRPSATQPERVGPPRTPPRRPPIIEGDEVGEVRKRQRPRETAPTSPTQASSTATSTAAPTTPTTPTAPTPPPATPSAPASTPSAIDVVVDSQVGPAETTPPTTPPQPIVEPEGVAEPRVSRKNRRKAKRAASMAASLKPSSSSSLPHPAIGADDDDVTDTGGQTISASGSGEGQPEAAPEIASPAPSTEGPATVIEPAASPALPSRDELQRLFDEFRREKRAAGQGDSIDVDFDAFADTILGESERLVAEHRCRGVRFEVAVADGEVSLRPRLLR